MSHGFSTESHANAPRSLSRLRARLDDTDPDPGPNVSLIVANSIAYGTRYGLLTVAGTSSAIVVQLALTSLGLTATLGMLADWFEWIRWIGVAYLLYLGIRQWPAAPVYLSRTRPQPRSFRAIALRGFLISLTNPKTLLFYGAFFPQFLVSDAPIGPQVACYR